MIKLSLFFVPLLLIASDIVPIPLHVNYDKKKAELEKKLFFDPILSKDNTVSCSSCHAFPGSGADNTSFSFGVDKIEEKLNSPTVLNSSYNFRQFWNGRLKNLKDQTLKSIDGSAIDKQEKRGYKVFKDLGCISYHNGINMYQTIGIIEQYKQLKEINRHYDITKRQKDKNIFKVSSLRNIELTKPYFHDGQISTLREAIEQMQILQLGIEPDIEAFLITLTGETPKILSDIK